MWSVYVWGCSVECVCVRVYSVDCMWCEGVRVVCSVEVVVCVCMLISTWGDVTSGGIKYYG